MNDKKNFIAFILDKAFGDYDYENFDRLQAEKITYFLQALMDKDEVQFSGFNFIKKSHGPYSGKIINILEWMSQRFALQHGKEDYEYKPTVDLSEEFSIDKFEHWHSKLSPEKKKVFEGIFEEGKGSWHITELSHTIEEVKEADNGEKIP